MATSLPIADVLDVMVSCFPNFNTANNPKSVSMISWLKSPKYQAVQERICRETDKTKRDADKATLPAITPSAVCEYRSADKVIRHTGLLQFDVDQKDNSHIGNYTDLKEQIAKLPFVAFCGLSVSKTGYWGLVPIAHPERHGQHFDALKRVFAHYRINLDDKPRSVVSLRGYSYDPDGYFASQVMVFDLYDEPAPKPARSVDFSRFNDEDDSGLLTRIARLMQEAGEGNRHAMLLKAARLAGGYIGAGRLDEQTIVYALETIASEWPMFPKSQKTIRDGIKYGLTAPIYPEERVTPLKINSKTTTPLAYRTYKSAQPIPEPPINVKIIPDEVLIVEPCNSYPADWDESTDCGPTAQPIEASKAMTVPTTRLTHPRAPLAFDAHEQLRRIQYCVLPLKAEEPNQPLTLATSPNRDVFARLLGIQPEQLPMYQLNA